MTITFNKKERLRSRKAFDELIKHGRSFNSHPFLIIWKKSDKEIKERCPVQISVSVPKKLFKHAVDRNIIKRRTHEAYRINKHKLIKHLEKKGYKFDIIFVYRKKDIADYKSIEEGITSAIKFLQKNYEKNNC